MKALSLSLSEVLLFVFVERARATHTYTATFFFKSFAWPRSQSLSPAGENRSTHLHFFYSVFYFVHKTLGTRTIRV